MIHLGGPAIHPSSAVGFVLIALVILNFVIMARLLNYLRDNFNEEWVEMGSPTLFLNNSIRNGFQVMCFVWSGQASDLGDSKLVTLVWMHRIIVLAFILGIIYLTPAFDISVNPSDKFRADPVFAHRPALTARAWSAPLADGNVPTQILTFKYRLLPSQDQHDKLRDALDHTRALYNAALAERVDCYRKTGKGRSWQDQFKGLTELRSDPTWTNYPVTLQRWPLKQVDLAFAAFFRRIKAGDGKAGFPRFKGREWFKTFGFSDRSGWAVRGVRLRMKGIGSIRLHLHRALPSEPMACKIKREGGNWYALLTVEVPCAMDHPGASVGIDVGITSLAALSTGELIANVRPSRHAQREMRLRQRQLARCRRGSKRRRKVKARLASLSAKIVRVRDTYLHQVTASLAARFGVIAVEKLNIKGLASGMLAREVHDVAWGRFNQYLRYKAARAGGKVVEVDPRFTSQICPECGQVSKKKLSQRTHLCDCGCILDRDVAAAKVILSRAGNGPEGRNVADYGERALEKMCLESSI